MGPGLNESHGECSFGNLGSSLGNMNTRPQLVESRPEPKPKEQSYLDPHPVEFSSPATNCSSIERETIRGNSIRADFEAIHQRSQFTFAAQSFLTNPGPSSKSLFAFHIFSSHVITKILYEFALTNCKVSSLVHHF